MMKRAVFMIAALLVGLLMSSTVGSAQEAARTPTNQDVQLISSSAPVGTLSHCGGSFACRHIYNDNSIYNLRITDNWAAYANPGTWRILRPGQNSAGIGVADADGFYVPLGCTATVAFVQQLGPGWYKVYDPQHIHVTNLTGTCQVW